MGEEEYEKRRGESKVCFNFKVSEGCNSVEIFAAHGKCYEEEVTSL